MLLHPPLLTFYGFSQTIIQTTLYTFFMCIELPVYYSVGIFGILGHALWFTLHTISLTSSCLFGPNGHISLGEIFVSINYYLMYILSE